MQNLFYLPNDFTGDFISQRIGWNIICHNAPCTDDNVIPNGNTRQNCHTCPNPYIISDCNILNHLPTNQAFLGIQRMLRSIDTHIGTYNYIITNFNFSTITDRKMMIEITVVPNFCKATIIAVQRKFKPAVLSQLLEKFW